jgi:hypothetical protein
MVLEHIYTSMGAKCVILVTWTTCYAWMYSHCVLMLVMDKTKRKPLKYFGCLGMTILSHFLVTKIKLGC